MKKIKKTHQWGIFSIIIARCPYCGRECKDLGHKGWVGDKIICKKCERKFELGLIKN